MDDGASPRLTGSAQWNYYTLLDRIADARRIISGMQDYIRTQCLVQ
ncbi:lysis system i-spanin subunit Rz [Cronobacter turicensis]|nr:lysis system i-spanin subunit Rz [Cronobacter turicensis]MDK1231703.1 lysis system i-spanin subunit Rz [Cronobacter turicensis]